VTASQKEKLLGECNKADIVALLIEIQKQLTDGYRNWMQGQEVLDAFPAQELFQAEADKDFGANWPSRWVCAGGQLYATRMIALKNDPVWCKISTFGLPYPPFDLNSGMWVRDVDRDEAETLGLIGPRDVIQPQTHGGLGVLPHLCFARGRVRHRSES
jgi:hypothetical protein